MRLLMAVVVGLACVVGGVVRGSSGGETYVPIQEAHDGLYHDPGHSGEGVDIRASGAGGSLFVVVYLGHSVYASGPTWYFASVTVGGVERRVPLFESNAYAGGGSVGEAPKVVGELRLRSDVATGALTAEVNLPELGEYVFALERLTPQLAPYRTCLLTDFSPPAPGC